MAKPPTVNDFVLMNNDGGGGYPGPSYINTAKTWQRFWQEMSDYPYIMIHNLGHDGFPMELDQVSRCVAAAARQPANLTWQERVNYDAFVEGALACPSYKMFYGGGSQRMSFPAVEGETSQEWADRALAEFAPFIRAKFNAICFDADTGLPHEWEDTYHSRIVDGLNGGGHQLHGMLRTILPAVELVHEAYKFRHAEWLAQNSVIFTFDFWESRQRKNDWDTMRDWPVLRPTESVRAYRILRLSGTDADKEREIDECRADGHIPVLKYNKLPASLRRSA